MAGVEEPEVEWGVECRVSGGLVHLLNVYDFSSLSFPFFSLNEWIPQLRVNQKSEVRVRGLYTGLLSFMLLRLLGRHTGDLLITSSHFTTEGNNCFVFIINRS